MPSVATVAQSLSLEIDAEYPGKYKFTEIVCPDVKPVPLTVIWSNGAPELGERVIVGVVAAATLPCCIQEVVGAQKGELKKQEARRSERTKA